MKKNVVLICGGLGNQLFQYAFGYAMAKKNNAELILDPLFAGERKYQLELFNVDYKKHFINQFEEILLQKMNNYNRKHIRASLLKIKLKHYKNILENKLNQFDESVFSNMDSYHLYYEGFWQSWKYFDEYKNDIKRQFVCNKQLSGKTLEYRNAILNSESISLHVRRTDYLTTGDNYSVPMDYYKKALDIIGYDETKHTLYIFSDDKEFIRNQFKKYSYVLIADVEDIEEFLLMSMCKNHIIANSTFSWWAAYLSQDNGNVVAPVIGNWYKEFYLPSWITLEVGNMNNLLQSGKILKL